MRLVLKLIILDVGHGLCIIVLDRMRVAVIDCGYDGSILVQTLKWLHITEVHHVIISHADMDHMGGLPHLLREFRVYNLSMNGDASKMGPMWRRSLEAIELAIQRGMCLHFGLTSTSPAISMGEVTIEFLGPPPLFGLSGAGGTYLDGHVLDSNTMSVVIGVMHQGHQVALLPADLDEFGLNALLAGHKNLEAKVLVFPHHGGNCGGDNYAFAYQLCSIVQPELIVPSLHRDRYPNPHDEIMRGIRDASPRAHIMCTQLSSKCCPQLFATDLSHLTDVPSMGEPSGACCGGSICINLNGAASTYEPSLPRHRQFVKTLQTEANRQSHAGPLCLH